MASFTTDVHSSTTNLRGQLQSGCVTSSNATTSSTVNHVDQHVTEIMSQRILPESLVQESLQFESINYFRRKNASLSNAVNQLQAKLDAMQARILEYQAKLRKLDIRNYGLQADMCTRALEHKTLSDQLRMRSVPLKLSSQKLQKESQLEERLQNDCQEPTLMQSTHLGVPMQNDYDTHSRDTAVNGANYFGQRSVEEKTDGKLIGLPGEKDLQRVELTYLKQEYERLKKAIQELQVKIDASEATSWEHRAAIAEKRNEDLQSILCCYESEIQELRRLLLLQNNSELLEDFSKNAENLAPGEINKPIEGQFCTADNKASRVRDIFEEYRNELKPKVGTEVIKDQDQRIWEAINSLEKSMQHSGNLD